MVPLFAEEPNSPTERETDKNLLSPTVRIDLPRHIVQVHETHATFRECTVYADIVGCKF